MNKDNFLSKIKHRYKNQLLVFLRCLNSINPFYWLYNLGFGAPQKVEHIWPSRNYSNRSGILYLLLDRPLAKRGVFIPRHTNGLTIDKSRFRTFHNEHVILSKLMEDLSLEAKDIFFVDIGAGDGIDMSNTYLIAAAGAQGIALEFNPSKFAMMSTTYRDLDQVSLSRCAVTPENVVDLLRGNFAPNIIDILNLDIDSYDYFVLERLFTNFRFKILCLEINPLFPLGIDFTVNYPSGEWSGWDHFQGMSISMAYKLLKKNGYSIVHVDRECLFAIDDSFISEAVAPIELSALDAIFTDSIKVSSHAWMLKEFRNQPLNILLDRYRTEFSKYKNSQYLLKPSNLESI